MTKLETIRLPEEPEARQNLEFSDELVEASQCLLDDLRHIRERWDNRLVLEDGTFWKSCLDGKCEVVIDLHGNIGFNEDGWVIRVSFYKHVRNVGIPSVRSMDGSKISDGDDWHKIIMLVLVAEAGDGPQQEVCVTARLDVAKNLGGKFWEGSLYKRVVRGSFEVFSFLGEREMGLGIFASTKQDGVVNPEVQGLPEIVNGVTYDSAVMLVDRLFGTVGEVEAIRITEKRNSSFMSNCDLVQFVGNNGAILNQRFNMLVGPFDL